MNHQPKSRHHTGAITDGNADVARDALTAPLFDFAITAADAGRRRLRRPRQRDGE